MITHQLEFRTNVFRCYWSKNWRRGEVIPIQPGIAFKQDVHIYLSLYLSLSIYLSFFLSSMGKKISQTPFSRVHVEFKGCQSRCHALKALHLGNQQPGGSKWRRRGKLQVLFLLSLSRGSWVLGSWVVISTLGVTRYLSMENLSATTKSNTHHFICPKECDFGA